MQAIDFSFGASNFNASQAKQDGIQAVVRYYSYDGGKNLSESEAQKLAEAGLWIVGNWEAGAVDAFNGASTGQAEGSTAGQQARACGQPTNVPIFYSVDNNLGADHLDPIEAYLRAAQEASGYPVAVYGSWELCLALLQAGVVQKTWTVETWKDSYTGGLSPSIEQLVQPTPARWGINYDLDTVFDTSVLWQPGKSYQQQTPIQQQTESEEPMGAYNQLIHGRQDCIVGVPVVGSTVNGLTVKAVTVSLIAQEDNTQAQVWVINNDRSVRAYNSTADPSMTLPYGRSNTLELKAGDNSVSVDNNSDSTLSILVEYSYS